MHEPEVLIFPKAEALAAAAAERIAGLAAEAVAARGSCLLALSGGSLPPHVHRLLVAEPLRARVPWERLSLIWADERYVPFDDPDSNYLMARQTLIDHAPIPPAQVYPVPTFSATADLAASVYDRQLQALLAAHGGQIDIAVLGMGPDGHTASLFPGFPQLDAPAEQLAVAVDGSPKPPPTRISLTPAALNRAATAIFLVAGADKAAKVRAALRGPYDPRATPAQVVRPAGGHVVWMLDAAAASNL
ncbi:6-phosphogluconolactonase [Oscillochloris sp. ZM17-4]|uniref:6-phosphogluconolactonase n=1 Tax=Oscillochloris sp. ZM17-4 TaxID=2866714 RepID=UPI001C72BABE|nr:6-phosphogluconolactonase [Oscillochloris sp. ZM17-4]MBX0329042.1 6-phosphogluconolactonase [Oscillochloris sp. ZM17-4]